MNSNVFPMGKDVHERLWQVVARMRADGWGVQRIEQHTGLTPEAQDSLLARTWQDR